MASTNDFIKNYQQINFKHPSRKDFISIITPVFIDAIGLDVTLNSLVRQSLGKTNFEIIVGNDGGYESIRGVCKKYNVQCIDIIPRQGSYVARNTALEESRGEFIAFIDADITADKDWLKRGSEVVKNADYVGGVVLFDRKQLKKLAHYYESVITFDNGRLFKRYHFIPTANLFVKRRVFENIGGFDARLRSGGDVEFGNRVFLSKIYKMTFVHNIIVFHPPRGYTKLVHKFRRVIMGANDLTNYYPDRLAYMKPRFFRMITGPLALVYKIIFKNNFGFIVKIKLVPFAFWFSLIMFYYRISIFYFGITKDRD